MHDKDALEPALDDTSQRGVKPKELLADSHYGSSECLQKGCKRDVDVVSPSMPAKGKQQGKLTLEDFELDDEGRVILCPQGHAPLETFPRQSYWFDNTSRLDGQFNTPTLKSKATFCRPVIF